jgi:Domain of unknown function (DUF5680)
MEPELVNELIEFILKAKQATYVGGGKALLPYRLGSHDLQFQYGDWAYHDSYLGEHDFMGEEIVYHRGIAVWGMNYFGRIIQPDKISSAQAGNVIKQSLTKMYQSGRFLGGFINWVDEFTYKDMNEGDPLYFTGKESIEFNSQLVYALDYHGGLIG